MKNKEPSGKETPRGKLLIFADILKEALSRWMNDSAPRLAAALAFYTVFSVAPLLILVISITGLVLGEPAARGEVVSQVQAWAGPQGAVLIQEVIRNAGASGGPATLIAALVLILGASAVFVELKGSLNIIWRVSDKAGGVKGFIRARVLSFLMILTLGALLLASIILGAALSIVFGLFRGAVGDSYFLLRAADILVSVLVAGALFAMIYKVLPDTDVEWGDVILGALFTAILFTAGRFFIGLYLANSSTASVYGAAGSLAVFLLWVYYSAQVFFFGAELTAVYARRYGSRTRENKGKGGVIRLNFSPSSPR